MKSGKAATATGRNTPNGHKIVLWKPLADFTCKHLKRGSKIYVEGSLRTRSWEGKDGSKKP